MGKFLTGSCMLLLMVLAASGCRSDRYYQSRAADRAREYLLDNAMELTAEQRWFVRFRDPVLLYGEGFEASGPTGQLHQICVVWQIPGQDKLYMVYGMSSDRMDFWRPRRLIRKNFVTENLPLDAAVRSCRSYAVSNLNERLSREEYNTVRFLSPEVLQTSFELNFNPEGTLSAADVEKLREKTSRQMQISLVWPCSDGINAVVFAGTALKEDLSGWALNFGGILPLKEVREKTVRGLKNSDDVKKTADEQIRKAVRETKGE